MGGSDYLGFHNVILSILGFVVIVISGGCIYAFVRAIFLFIFSHGDETKIKAAWNSIRYMIIGIIFTIAFLFIFQYGFKWMKMDGYENYTAKNIFNKAGELVGSLFQFIGEYEGDTTSQSQYDL